MILLHILYEKMFDGSIHWVFLVLFVVIDLAKFRTEEMFVATVCADTKRDTSIQTPKCSRSCNYPRQSACPGLSSTFAVCTRHCAYKSFVCTWHT